MQWDIMLIQKVTTPMAIVKVVLDAFSISWAPVIGRAPPVAAINSLGL
jgi:hypothetical protein